MSYFKASIYALLTAPMILFNVSHASLYTTGDLEYDDVTGVITNQLTRQTYLGWDLISSYTYQDTVDATASGGIYSDYHIANFDEAKTFFEAAMYGTCVVRSTGMTSCILQHSYGLANGWFGDNFRSDRDMAWFKYDADYVGSINMKYGHIDHYIYANHMSYLSSDGYSHSGTSAATPVSWLLVANTTSAVPVPAAIWLFGTALIGLVGYGKRKSKVPV